MLKAEIKKARKTQEFVSKINTDVLLTELTKNKHNHLENKTNADILAEMREMLDLYNLDINTFLPKLLGYRFAGDLVDLNPGQHIRWITLSDNPVLTNGGIYLSSAFTNNGTMLKVKLYGRSIANVSLQNSLVFQKLSFGENVILYASDIVNG
jgi:hypothetical protein